MQCKSTYKFLIYTKVSQKEARKVTGLFKFITSLPYYQIYVCTFTSLA